MSDASTPDLIKADGNVPDKAALYSKIANCKTLPSLPGVAVQVLELAGSADVDLGKIAKVVEQDPALTTKILRTVNSSFYARSSTVSTLSHALVILGLQSVKTLVLSFSLVNQLNKPSKAEFDHQAYWKRSIYTATAARTIAQKAGVVQAEEAFLSALLADMGMLAMAETLGDEYLRAVESAKTHAATTTLEAAAFGADHAEVGQWLAEQWKLPPLLTQPILAHHNTSRNTDTQLAKLISCVAMGSQCADVFIEADMSVITAMRQSLMSLCKLSEPDADALLSDIGKKTADTAKLFEISIGSPVNYEDIIKQANSKLVEITLQAQQQVSQLAEQNTVLREKATTDRLTGLSNRASFDEFLSAKLAEAVGNGSTFSLILMDVDKFKSVNDTHGHPVGDEVLRQVARVVKSAARSDDLPTRYGGEEMAVLLPNTTRASAGAIAESIRKALEAKPINTEAGPLKITASFGVATYDASCPLGKPELLLKAADLAVYNAKKSGRNNVKVFTPKTTTKAA